MRSFFGPFVIAGALACGCTQADGGQAAPTYKVLDDAATQLRDDFNRASGSVRLLFVVDPICPGCLLGLDEVNRALLSTTDDPRVQTFVVHVPVLGAQAKDVAPSTKLLHNHRVNHYWNPTGAFGRTLAEAVGLKRGDALVYAWDVWLIYGPEAHWAGAHPPQPRLLMHQLRALRGSAEFPELDGEFFAREARKLLAQLPPANSSR